MGSENENATTSPRKGVGFKALANKHSLEIAMEAQVANGGKKKGNSFYAAIMGASAMETSRLPTGMSPYLKVDRELLNSLAREEVQKVNLTGQSLSAAALRVLMYAITRCKSIVSFNMAQCELTDDLMPNFGEIITNSPSLDMMDLSDNKIGDEGAAALGKGLGASRSLEHLYLQFNNIGGRGACSLAAALVHQQESKLVSVDLSNNPMGDEGAVALGTALQQCGERSTLQALHLNNCGIGDEGAAALAGAMEQCPRLKKVYLNDNQMTRAGSRMLAAVTDADPDTVAITMRNILAPAERRAHIPAPARPQPDAVAAPEGDEAPPEGAGPEGGAPQEEPEVEASGASDPPVDAEP